jgi:hypothetical protein
VPSLGDSEVMEVITHKVTRNCLEFDDEGIVCPHELALRILEEHVELGSETEHDKHFFRKPFKIQ